jgi:putative FmdB family regulatory protein
MPLYDRRCASCSSVFEISCKISEKSNEFACPQCKSTAGEWQIGTPMAIAPDRLGRGRDGGMNEVLQKIHERNPGSILKNRNSF